MSSAVAQTPCAAPAPVCAAAERVFSVIAFDPAASAVLIEPGLLVTNRHVVANLETATVRTPSGTKIAARVVPSAYDGDLALLDAPGLDAGTPFDLAPPPAPGTVLRTIGHDIGRDAVRVYADGELRFAPPPGKPLARLHHTARSQPGNSGGAVVNDAGKLVGIATSGGEGRSEAIPVSEIALLRRLSGPDHAQAHARIGLAYRQCIAATDAAASRAAMSDEQAGFMAERCTASNNRQLLDLAAQALGKRGRLDASAALFEAAMAQDPNALNTRLGLVVTLHLAKRFADEVPHLKFLIMALPADVQVLRFAIQAGTWGGAPNLADKGMELLKRHHPKLAPLAEKFRQAPPPR